MATHVKVLAVLYLVFSALGLFAAFVVGAVFGIAGAASAASGGEGVAALPLIGLTGMALSAFLLVVSIPGLVAGVGLLKFKPWARTLTIVLSALNLINIPIGTAVGIYGLYVLLSEEGSRLFAVPPPVTA
jgi:hypothetical protein